MIAQKTKNAPKCWQTPYEEISPKVHLGTTLGKQDWNKARGAIKIVTRAGPDDWVSCKRHWFSYLWALKSTQESFKKSTKTNYSETIAPKPQNYFQKYLPNGTSWLTCCGNVIPGAESLKFVYLFLIADPRHIWMMLGYFFVRAFSARPQNRGSVKEWWEFHQLFSVLIVHRLLFASTSEQRALQFIPTVLPVTSEGNSGQEGVDTPPGVFH